MSKHARRTLFKGVAGAAGLAAFTRLSGLRTIRAQGADYEVVSFGPVEEGVLSERTFRPNPGRFRGISAGGTAFGSLAASPEKFFPILAGADGSVTKLKSGEFGGQVWALNESGVAAGVAYENIAGNSTPDHNGTIPAVWADGEFTRLTVPDPANEWERAGGAAESVSDDGRIFGNASGYELLWIDGEPQVLPDTDSAGGSLVHKAILPDGTLIGYTSQYTDDAFRYEWGAIDGTSLTPFSGLDAGSFAPGLIAMNSASEVLLSTTPTDLPLAYITGPGVETVTIDVRADGVYFSVTSFNAAREVVGSWRARRDLPVEPALWRDGELTPLSALLPADHGYSLVSVSGISDDGIISASGWDADGGFHPLLFVPA